MVLNVDSLLSTDKSGYELGRQLQAAQMQLNQKIVDIVGQEHFFNFKLNASLSTLDAQKAHDYQNACEQLGKIIEKVGDALIDKNEIVCAFFNRYELYFPYFRKQFLNNLYCRYDFFVTPAGELKFCETNSHGGGGFLNAGLLSNILYEQLNLASVAIPFRNHNLLYFAQQILAIEKQIGLPTKAFAVLYDSQTPLFKRASLAFFDLVFLKKQFESLGRRAFLVDIKDLTTNAQRELCYEGTPISTVFAKIKPRFRRYGQTKEVGYQALLAAMQAGNCLLMNSWLGLTVFEDKSLFAFLTDEKFRSFFTAEEWAFLQKHIPKTYCLCDALSSAEQAEFRENKDQYVLKAANSERGDNVFLGELTEPSVWTQLLQTCKQEDYIVQQKVDASKVKVFSLVNGQLLNHNMHQIYSCFYVGGQVCGFMDRVSSEQVINTAKNGFTRPVFIDKYD